MEPINLRDIFVHSKFGAVEIGQTMDEVTVILGEPESINDLDNVKFFHYGWYEFWFTTYFDSSNEYKLSAFQNDSYRYENGFEAKSEDQKLELDLWIFELGVTIESVERVLHAENLTYTKYQKYETTYLEFENKAVILFDEDKDSDSCTCSGWMFHPEY